jgi:hypothetical protein
MQLLSAEPGKLNYFRVLGCANPPNLRVGSNMILLAESDDRCLPELRQPSLLLSNPQIIEARNDKTIK